MIDLHIHSVYSDGAGNVMDIARKATERNLDAIAIVDHGSDHFLGLTERKAGKRDMEIRDAEAIYGIEILSGIEVEIHGDGNLFIPGKFDYILISSHSTMTPQKINMMMDTVKKQRVSAIAHFGAFGFMGFEDMELLEGLFDLLESKKVSVEINEAYMAPPDFILEMCRDRDLTCTVGSDSHRIEDVGKVEWAMKCMETYFKGRLIRW